ncbi:MAG: DUF1997 domain-containing protein [Pegethrix bostrychoides GSE-TBD4-15B]|jgi:hypothetical protein|uniref:DUF1997 domain-containing protein n=1 Tax=Pegethrix bostrychoides GSE-TBD4-15B TaxID=2839662 RepID=A0A951U7I2_9CYAN|nr:DUF1997 domain-containing protein [Pegethrix bostrychoides GSE-TBD4-15B]
MSVCFSAIQSVEILVPAQPIPIQHYLRQPQRLIQALIDPSQVEPLGQDRFRFKMRPLQFLALSLQPTVDLHIWAEADGTIRLESVGCDIRGVEYINQRFSLNLAGQLTPVQMQSKTYLKGMADLKVQVELPPPLSFTPRLLVETTGNGLLRSVLLTIKQRLVHQLLSDYCAWVKAQQAVDSPSLQWSPKGSLL